MKKLFVVVSLLLPLSLVAQTWMYQHDTSIKVYAYGQQQTLAWCGGFNSPQFSMGDINNDGIQDLVVYEPYNSVRTFINKGTAGNPYYIYAPEYEVNFPAIFDYLILADYNRDGIPDLFQQGQYGFEVYRGYYNSANQLCFTFYENLFYDNDTNTHGWANAFNSPGDIPTIVDVDGDGDLDFLSFNIAGGYINYYKNMQVEMGLSPDSIHIELASANWGDFFDTVAFFSHSGHSLCLFDHDMNGEYDCLIGSINSGKMHYFQNGRIPYNPTGPDSMVSEDTAWQSGGTMVNLPDWPIAYNVDINQDGKKDLLISPNALVAGAMNYNNIWYYKNMSTTGSPNWQFQSDSFLIDQSIDLGTAGYPTLFDYNKDGRPDMFIGSDGYRQADGTLRSRISYYLNTGTAGSPSFTLQTNDFMSLSTYNWAGAAPAFGDIDNDGKSDMVIGHSDGTLSYFKNMAASESVTPDWVLVAQDMTDESGDTINVGGYAAPVIYDIDKDGRKDLVIGDINGGLYYYRNVTTTPGFISLKLVNTDLGYVGADTGLVYSTPFIGKIDTSGTDYLLIGSNSGLLYKFTGFQSGDTAGTYPLLSSAYSYIDTMHGLYYDDYIFGSGGGVYDGNRSAPVVGDIAGDGSLYMIVGNNKGGAELYKAGFSNLGVPPITANTKGQINVYPNPATTTLTIQSTVEPINAVSISNILGQTVYSRQMAVGSLQCTVDLSGMAAGVYFVKINGSEVRKFVKE